jgi:hypothetical protein
MLLYPEPKNKHSYTAIPQYNVSVAVLKKTVKEL